MVRSAVLAMTLVAAASAGPFAVAQTTTTAPAATGFTPQSGQSGKDVIWVPTPQALVDKMLDMAELKPEDVVIDLGSGDGRTVITAAKRGNRAHGIEYNPDMVTLSRANAEKEGVGGRATFVQGDIFASNFSEATVITLFLLPNLNVRLRPILLDMKPGTRVLSNSFDMAEWKPDDQFEGGINCTGWCRAYKWIIPAKVGGQWQLGDGTLELTQTFQMLSGSLGRGGQTASISDAKMNGTEIRFSVDGRRHVGQVNGNSMSGQVDGGGTWQATRR